MRRFSTLLLTHYSGIACLQRSFSSNMKMEGVGDVMNGRTNEVAKTPQPSPKGRILNFYLNM